jgi:hypothetical protein
VSKLSPPNLLALQNRGLLLDVFVFVINIFLMRWLTGYFIDLIRLSNAGNQFAQATLFLACVGMWVLPAAGAVLKRWHYHQRRRKASNEEDSAVAGCVFNPVFYLSLNLVLVSIIVAALGNFVFGDRLMDDGSIFVPLILTGMACTIVQTILIYRYFTPPQKPPRFQFLQRPESEALGDVFIFLNMILFQVGWNLLTFGTMARPSGPGEFLGRLFFLCFIALLIYFPPRMFYLAEDIDRGRTWIMMLLANSPVIIRVLVGA